MKYPLFQIHVDTEEALLEIKKVFESGFINEGAQVTMLNAQLSKLMQTDKLTLVNSCTSALTLALHLAGVGAEDEVISTPMTCAATNTPIIASKAKIVWTDIDPASGMPTAELIEKKITSKTKAVIAVAWAGTPPDMMISALCRSLGIKYIIDAAHAFGASYFKKPIHEFADYTAYSFQAIKHFTTGDGGALICRSADDYKRANALKWFGIDRESAKDENGNWKGRQWEVDIVESGYKFNMNNVAAAIGLSQIPYIEQIVRWHRANAAIYRDAFKDCKNITGLSLPLGAVSSFWTYPMLVKNSVNRDSLIAAFNAHGIGAGIVHTPNDTCTAFKEFVSDLPGVREFASRQFSLPCGWWINSCAAEFIAQKVIELSE